VSSAGLFTSTITGLICQSLKGLEVNAKPLLEGGERGARFFIKGETTHKSNLHMGRFETIGSSYTWILEYSPSIANSKNSWSEHIGFGI